MKSKIIGLVFIALIIGGLLLATYMHRPKPANKTIDEIQTNEGYPVKLGFVVRGNIQQSVELTGSIAPLDKQVITTKVSGKVADVYVREGDSVKKGQVILKLEQDTYVNALKRAQMTLNQQRASLSAAIVDKKNTAIQTDAGVRSAIAQLNSAREQLKLVKKPYRNQQIVQAENDVANAKITYNKSQKDYERYQTLYGKGAVSLSDLESMKLTADVNKKRLDSYNEQLSLLKEQGRDEDIAKAESAVSVAEEGLRTAKANAFAVAMKDETIKIQQAAVASAQAGVDTARDDLQNTVIVSKINGKMASRSVDPGQTISPGASLGEIISLSNMYYLANVSEMDIDSIEPGQKVDIVFDALPGEKFVGKVSSIYPTSDSMTRIYPVRISVGNNPRIKAGMFVKGRVFTNFHNNVLLVPTSSVKYKDGSDYVYKSGAGDTEVDRVTVKIISRGSENTEVVPTVGTLEAGDKIVTSGTELISDKSKIYVEGNKK